MVEEVKSQTRAEKRKERREARPRYPIRKARRDKRAAKTAARAEAYKNRDRYSTAKRLNIDQLRYQFDQGARPNRYEVNFFCPNLGLNLEGVRCISATLPGRQLETADWSEYGPTRKMPYQLGMDGQEVSFTFICDSSFADRFMIEAWQSAIFMGQNYVSSESTKIDEGLAENQAGRGKIDSNYRVLNNERKSLLEKQGDVAMGNSINPQFEYYTNYIGEIIIKQITRSDKKSLQYRIHEAYPISFAPMELSADGTDELMKFETTFAFRTWESEYSNPNPVSGINKGRRWLDLWASVTNLQKGGNSSNNTLQRFNDRLATLGGIFG
jgi:hypothetical protein